MSSSSGPTGTRQVQSISMPTKPGTAWSTSFAPKRSVCGPITDDSNAGTIHAQQHCSAGTLWGNERDDPSRPRARPRLSLMHNSRSASATTPDSAGSSDASCTTVGPVEEVGEAAQGSVAKYCICISALLAFALACAGGDQSKRRTVSASASTLTPQEFFVRSEA